MNDGEYKPQVGLDSVYIAPVTVDSLAAYTVGTPVYFAPALTATVEPTQSSEVLYADDAAYETANSEGETVYTINVTNIPMELLALITGKTFDAASGRVFDHESTPPYFALGYRSVKSNGSYRYFWYHKGRFNIPKEAAATKGATPDFKAQEITYTAIHTTHKFTVSSGVDKSSKRIIGDEDTTNFSATGWFTAVQVPGWTAPDALALSESVPADAATGIAVAANQTLTFNNAITDASLNGIILVKASDGTVIAGTKALDTAKKVVTINPTASLDASTEYDLFYAVTDVYGQTLTGVVNFTTTS